MAQFDKAPIRRKINPAWVIAGVAAAAAVAVPSWLANSEDAGLAKEAASVKADLAKGEVTIKSDPMYLRVREYGSALAAADSLSKWKEANPTWFAFLRDVEAALPKDATVRSLSYSPERASLSLQLTVPTAGRLVQSLEALEDMDGISGVGYNSFVTEKITFKGDKAQYSGYSAKVEANVDRAWLEKEYAKAEDLSKARRASLAPAGQSGSNDNQR